MHLILEFCPNNLDRVIRNKKILLKPEHVKCFTYMMFAGLECLHSHYILHRG
jgi:serine/threonine protein kinase